MAIFEEFEVKAKHLKIFFYSRSLQINFLLKNCIYDAIAIFFGGLKLIIIFSFLETSWEIEAFNHKAENKVSSANPSRRTTGYYFA